MASSLDRADPAYAGQAIQPRLPPHLRLPRLRRQQPLFWRYPRARLIELYDAHLSARHLDIGVGAGRLLDECRFPVAAPELTLMDLNPNSLATAAGQLARYSPRTHRANVLEPWGLEPGVISNRGDDLGGVEAALAAAFDDYAVEQVGTVAVFSAREAE